MTLNPTMPLTSGAALPEDASMTLMGRAAQARAWLFDAALPLWWERGFDRSSACFHERLGAEDASAPLRVRVQARQTIVYAFAGGLGWKGPWRAAVEAGAQVLTSRCLRPDGGTRHLLKPDGAPLDERRDLYDLAFVVFALAQAGAALERGDLLAAAERLVDWSYAHWAHALGGFREGDVTPTPPRRQNPHMHMFEALLALFEATKASVHLERANAIAKLFAGKLFDHRLGALREYYDDAWRPRPGEEGQICEPGHQFEWSWLLHRWNALGGGDLEVLAERLRVHGEAFGVDSPSGAVYGEVYLDGRVRAQTSRLWPHTERLKANLARYERNRDQAAGEAAMQAFDMIMRYCDTPTPGLWRDRRLPDGNFVDEPAPASSFYHLMIAMAELIRVARLAN